MSSICENHQKKAVQTWLQKEKTEKGGDRREKRRRNEKLHYRFCHAEGVLIILILHTGVQKEIIMSSDNAWTSDDGSEELEAPGKKLNVFFVDNEDYSTLERA